MTRRKQTRGRCTLCGKEMTQGGLARHLPACADHEAATAASTQPVQMLYRLQVTDRYHKDYWLLLDMRGQASLADLDAYLRAIWVECCGHLSMFNVDRTHYIDERTPLDYGIERPLTTPIARVLAPMMTFTYEYDFGSTTELQLKVLDVRQARPLTRHPIFLLARNNAPEFDCLVCGRPATHLCMECLYEDETSGYLCAQHVRNHPHDDYGAPIPIVNSPRLGVCGYEGPATPPY